jgi:hypothetical protein
MAADYLAVMLKAGRRETFVTRYRATQAPSCGCMAKQVAGRQAGDAVDAE